MRWLALALLLLAAPAWAQTGSNPFPNTAPVGSVSGTVGQVTCSPTTGNVVCGLPTTITQNVNFTGTFQVGGASILTAPLALTSLATQAANTVLVNATSGIATPTAQAISGCAAAADALIWTTNTGFGCNTSITAAAAPVSGLTGAGTGVVTALGVNVGSAGAFVAFNGALGTPSSGTLTNATGLPAGNLAGTTLATGIVTSSLTSTGTLTGGATGAGFTVALGTSTITGVLPTANGGAGTISGALKANGSGTVSQAACADLSNAAASCSTDATNGTNISSGTVGVAVGGTSVASLPATPGGRLTLTSGTPVMTATASAAASVLWTPYQGALMWFYDGTKFYPKVCAELTNVLANSSTGNAGPAAAVANSNYDLFAWDNAGTCTLTRAAVWTNNTTRANTLVYQNGLLLNNATITNGPAASRGTYVGSIHTDSGGATVTWQFGAAASGGTACIFGLWNEYNRVLTQCRVQDNGTAYTYTTATTRQARASAGNQGSFMVGQQEDSIAAVDTVSLATAAALNAIAYVGVALDSTTTLPINGFCDAETAAILTCSKLITLSTFPAIGLHTISANELGDGTNANTYDAGQTNTLSFIVRN